MPRRQPKMHRLRKYSSMEWVYTSGNDSDTGDDVQRMIVKEGDNVAIFPDDQRAIPTEDGSLPAMGYWYGKVNDIYVARNSQDAWINIQWYYRRVDLEDECVDIAEFVGDYELVRSDHKSLVDMHCIEDHATIQIYDEADLTQCEIPPATLYCRWEISIEIKAGKLQKAHLTNAQQDTPMLCGCNQCYFPRGLYFPTVEQRYCRTCACWFNRTCLEDLDCKVDTRPRTNLSPAFNNVQLDKEFLRTVTRPISRGGPYGIVGNSRRFVEANSLLIESKTLGRLPHGWKDRLSQCAPSSDTDDVIHYRCPVCAKAVLC